MKISRKRTPIAFATAALATALVALPATASADDKGAVYYGYGPGPTVDGEFGDWGGIPHLPNLPNAVANQGKIQAHYNCATGYLTVGVSGLHGGSPKLDVQSLGPPTNGTSSYLTVLDDKQAEIMTAPNGAGTAWARGPRGFETSFAIAPGKYTLKYHASSGVVSASGTDVPPPVYQLGGYADIYIHCPVLKPTKTATGRYAHLYDWSVKKTATVGKKGSKAPTVDYRVDVTKSGPRVIDRDVVGTISVHNPYRVNIPSVLVGDKGVYGARSECKITSAKLYDPKTKQARPYPFDARRDFVSFKTLPAGYTASVGYICHPHPEIPVSKLPTKPENVGWVKFPHPNGERPRPPVENGEVEVAGLGGVQPKRRTEYVKQGFSFSNLNQSYFTNVKVYDIFGGKKAKLGQLSDSGTYSYSKKLTPPKAGCKVHKNTAKLVNHGAPGWGPASSAYVKICRNKDGSVSTHAKNPKKPATDNNHGPKVCYVNLRTAVRGATRMRPRGSWYLATVRNRGRLAAGYVKSRISVSRGLKITAVRGVPRKAVKIRGRHVYVAHKWIPRGKARTVRVLVQPKRRVRRGKGIIKMVSMHKCDTDRAGKRVYWGRRNGNTPPPPV